MKSSAPHRRPPSAICRRPGALTLLVVGLCCLCLSSAVAHAQGKIAVIDLRRAVADTEDGLRVQSRLQQLSDSRQNQFEAKEKAYADAKAQFEKLSRDKKVSEKKLRKRYAALEKMAVDLQSTQLAYRRELQQQQNELTYPIIKHMLALVRRLAEKGSYDMVLNREAVPYYRSDLDITDRIIQMYNFSQGAKGKAPSGKKDTKRGAGAKPTPRSAEGKQGAKPPQR